MNDYLISYIYSHLKPQLIFCYCMDSETEQNVEPLISLIQYNQEIGFK